MGLIMTFLLEFPVQSLNIYCGSAWESN
jgi:hypothetical protein